MSQYGKYRASVKKIQQHYNRFATAAGNGQYITADGYFGNDTEAAIIRFQKFYKLDADGVVGSKTWDKLRWF